ncbi:MAG: hypothetical protein Tsb0020_54540 [Haliangiales bacterium]
MGLKAVYFVAGFACGRLGLMGLVPCGPGGPAEGEEVGLVEGEEAGAAEGDSQAQPSAADPSTAATGAEAGSGVDGDDSAAAGSSDQQRTATQGADAAGDEGAERDDGAQGDDEAGAETERSRARRPPAKSEGPAPVTAARYQRSYERTLTRYQQLFDLVAGDSPLKPAVDQLERQLTQLPIAPDGAQVAPAYAKLSKLRAQVERLLKQARASR